jgi:hypothetical protein
MSSTPTSTYQVRECIKGFANNQVNDPNKARFCMQHANEWFWDVVESLPHHVENATVASPRRFIIFNYTSRSKYKIENITIRADKAEITFNLPLMDNINSSSPRNVPSDRYHLHKIRHIVKDVYRYEAYMQSISPQFQYLMKNKNGDDYQDHHGRWWNIHHIKREVESWIKDITYTLGSAIYGSRESEYSTNGTNGVVDMYLHQYVHYIDHFRTLVTDNSNSIFREFVAKLEELRAIKNSKAHAHQNRLTGSYRNLKSWFSRHNPVDKLMNIQHAIEFLRFIDATNNTTIISIELSCPGITESNNIIFHGGKTAFFEGTNWMVSPNKVHTEFNVSNIEPMNEEHHEDHHEEMATAPVTVTTPTSSSVSIALPSSMSTLNPSR